MRHNSNLYCHGAMPRNRSIDAFCWGVNGFWCRRSCSGNLRCLAWLHRLAWQDCGTAVRLGLAALCVASLACNPTIEQRADLYELQILPEGPVEFGSVSPFIDVGSVPTSALSVGPHIAEEVVAIESIVVEESDTTNAFHVDLPSDLLPLSLAAGQSFVFDIRFPSEQYLGRSTSGDYEGTLVVKAVSEDNYWISSTVVLAGTLCEDGNHDGICE